MEVTLFEIHLDESPVTANAPFAGRGKGESDEESGTEIDVDEDEIEPSADEGSSGSKAGAVVALLGIVGLAIAVRRFVGGGDSGGGQTADAPTTVQAPTTE